jgi:nanoRNase/pAp phosphatase (c-di-AMP/oligoRNAs hydrolase)
MQATLLLAGIYEDTGNLSFLHPGGGHAAGWLLERKADLNILNRFLKPAYGEKHRTVLFQMLQHAKRTRIKGHSVSIHQVIIDGRVDSLAVIMHMVLRSQTWMRPSGFSPNPARTAAW